MVQFPVLLLVESYRPLSKPVKLEMLPVKTTNLALTIVFSQILCCSNIYLLYVIFCSKKIKFKPNLELFYCRFVVDVMLTLSVTINKIYFLIISISNQYAVKNISFFTLWPSLIFSTMRSTMGFLITFDRLVAIYFPISYHLHRRKISIYFVIMILILSVAFNQYVLFGYCLYSIDVPLECDDYKCTVNLCYFNYNLTKEQYVYFLIEFMTIILCLRLFIRYLTAKSEISKFLSQATRVTLLDSFVIFVFNILPSYITAQFPATNFEIFGPFISLFKRFGALIETILIFRILKRDTSSNTVSPMS